MAQSQYKELPTDPSSQERLLSHGSEAEYTITRRSGLYTLAAPLIWLTGSVCFLLAAAIFSATRTSEPAGSSLVYSPAQEAVKYKTSIFPDSFVHKNDHFMGDPSDFIDANWQATYDLPSVITKEQADQLAMPTIELLDEKGSYVILLDIFHSMHCLNEVRKSLRPDYYAPYSERMNTTEEIARGHLDHCVEHLRMALWCGADISPISFHYKKNGYPEGVSGYPHSCRDPGAILQWAREHQLNRPIPLLQG